MGGWGDDTPAKETLNNVKQMIKDLRLDICAEQAFVPGVRRGYAILPYNAKEGEDQQPLRERLSTALRRVRQANIQMGVHADGKAKYLWLQLRVDNWPASARGSASRSGRRSARWRQSGQPAPSGSKG